MQIVIEKKDERRDLYKRVVSEQNLLPERGNWVLYLREEKRRRKQMEMYKRRLSVSGM